MKKNLRFHSLVLLSMMTGGIIFSTSCEKEGNKPKIEYEAATDIDGNVYDAVTIGTQTWMIQDLKTSKYRNGDSISTGLGDNDWENAASGACAIYNNVEANNTIYGKLYNWDAVTDSRHLCPAGWHVPADAELTTLINNLGGESVAGGAFYQFKILCS